MGGVRRRLEVLVLAVVTLAVIGSTGWLVLELRRAERLVTERGELLRLLDPTSGTLSPGRGLTSPVGAFLG